MKSTIKSINITILIIGIVLGLPYISEGSPSLFNQPKDAFHTFLGAAFAFYLLIYPGLKEKLIEKAQDSVN